MPISSDSIPRSLLWIRKIELGPSLCAANPGDIEAALLAYEKDLFPRSTYAAAEADRNLKLCFDDCASKSDRPVHQLPVREVIALQVKCPQTNPSKSVLLLG